MSAPRLVSVVAPTRDRPELLAEALASIRAVEGPDLKFEILVGDNGVSPQTRQTAEAFGAIYAHTTREGAGAARNLCFSRASGAFIAFLDDDDLWRPGHIRDHIAALDADPTLDAVISKAILTDTERKPYGEPWPPKAPESPDDLLKQMLSGLFPQLGTVVARAHVPVAYGGFDETLIYGQDLDWLLRIARKRRLGFVDFLGTYVRARPAGSFDELQVRRVKYDRKVFYRHAVPEWRLWSSPLEFYQAQANTIWHFYRYFVDAAVSRAASGDRAGATAAVGSAFKVFPVRAALHIATLRPLGRAYFSALLGLGRARGQAALHD